MWSNRKRVFVDEYLQCWNASEAARRAGYSEHTAGSQGARLLKDVEIAAEIARRVADVAMKADEVLLLLAEHGRGDLGDFLKIDASGDAKIDLAGARAKGKLRLLKSFKRTRAGAEFEMYSAQEALFKLGNALGVLRENIAVSGPVELHIVYDDEIPDTSTATA